MQEITIPQPNEIVLQDKQIQIVGFDEMMAQLDEIGEYLLGLEVTYDNIKDSKSIVAGVRKMIRNLRSERIAFKKEYMKPLETLDYQVNEIDKKAQAYEDTVRRRIRKLEQLERDKKQQEIEKLFEKRLRAYGGKPVEKLYDFDDFFDPKYLNKSVSMNKIEENMVDFFEQRREDTGALINFADTTDLNRDTVVAKFLECGDVSKTINYFKSLELEKKEVREALEKQKFKPKNEPAEPHYYIKIKESDYAKVCELLGLGNIEFELVDLE